MRRRFTERWWCIRDIDTIAGRATYDMRKRTERASHWDIFIFSAFDDGRQALVWYVSTIGYRYFLMRVDDIYRYISVSILKANAERPPLQQRRVRRAYLSLSRGPQLRLWRRVSVTSAKAYAFLELIYFMHLLSTWVLRLILRFAIMIMLSLRTFFTRALSRPLITIQRHCTQQISFEYWLRDRVSRAHKGRDKIPLAILMMREVDFMLRAAFSFRLHFTPLNGIPFCCSLSLRLYLSRAYIMILFIKFPFTVNFTKR